MTLSSLFKFSDDGIQFLPDWPPNMSECPWSLTHPYPAETIEKTDLIESKVMALKELQYDIIML